jgi:hypothetical protein
MEKGREIWYVECKEPVEVRVMTVAMELAKYKLDLACVQEVRWDKGHYKSRGLYFLFMEKGAKIINLEQDFLYTTEQ